MKSAVDAVRPIRGKVRQQYDARTVWREVSGRHQRGHRPHARQYVEPIKVQRCRRGIELAATEQRLRRYVNALSSRVDKQSFGIVRAVRVSESIPQPRYVSASAGRLRDAINVDFFATRGVVADIAKIKDAMTGGVGTGRHILPVDVLRAAQRVDRRRVATRVDLEETRAVAAVVVRVHVPPIGARGQSTRFADALVGEAEQRGRRRHRRRAGGRRRDSERDEPAQRDDAEQRSTDDVQCASQICRRASDHCGTRRFVCKPLPGRASP